MRASRFIIAILLAALMLLPSRFCCTLMAHELASADAGVGHLPCCPMEWGGSEDGDDESQPVAPARQCSCGCCCDRYLSDAQPQIDVASPDLFVAFHSAPVVLVTEARSLYDGVQSPPWHTTRRTLSLLCRWNC